MSDGDLRLFGVKRRDFLRLKIINLGENWWIWGFKRGNLGSEGGIWGFKGGFGVKNEDFGTQFVADLRTKG